MGSFPIFPYDIFLKGGFKVRLALIGYGKMGRSIDNLSQQFGHQIVARIDSKDWDRIELAQAEMCLEFTTPKAVLANVKKIAAAQKNCVIGTTGWYDQLADIQAIADEYSIGVLYAPNFSLGVFLFLETVAYAAKLFSPYSEYDASCFEAHHKEKKDLPSGTALQIAKRVRERFKRGDHLPISSLRCGSIPGIHEVVFDAPCDTIEIRHTARTREGFAHGALLAAEWLHGKKGLYTFADCIREKVGAI